MKETISIQVQIANRTYSLKVSPDEEKGIQKAASLINDRLSELQKNHGVKDAHDSLAMLSLQLASEQLNGKSVSESVEKESLQRLNALQEKVGTYVNSL